MKAEIKTTNNIHDILYPVSVIKTQKLTGIKIYKIRIFTKATLLSLMHINPLYFFISLFCV